MRTSTRLTVAGTTVAAAAAFVAAITDFGELCGTFQECPEPGAEATHTLLVAIQVVGVAIALLGVVVRARALPAGGPAPRQVWRAAAAAGLVGAGAAYLLTTPAIGVLLFLRHASVGATLVVAAALAGCVTTLLNAGGPPTRAARLAGPLAGATACATTVAALMMPFVTIGRFPETFWIFVPIHGLTLAAAVLIVGPAVTPVRLVGLLAAGALAVGAGYLPYVLGTDHRTSVAADQPPVVALPPSPSAAPVAPPTTTSPTPAPKPVRASVACDPAALVWSAGGFDGAMGLRNAAITVRNTARRACFVEPVDQVRILQDGRPLQLTITPGDVAESADGPPRTRLGIAAGGVAWFALIWRGYGAAADRTTPQQLSVGVPPVPVPLTAGEFFDLVDGGTVYASGWAPGPR